MSCSILSPLRPNYWHTTNAIPLVGWIHPHLWLACSPGLFKPDMTKHVCTCMGDLDCISDHCDSGYKIYIKLPFNQLSHFLHFVQYLSFSCVNVVHTPCGLEGLTWFRNFWQSLVRQKNVPSMFYMSCNQCLKSRRVPSQLNVTRADTNLGYKPRNWRVNNYCEYYYKSSWYETFVSQTSCGKKCS